MPRRTGNSREDGGVWLLSLVGLVLVSMAGLATAAEPLCEPGFELHPTAVPRVVSVSFAMRAVSPGDVIVRWLGQSSFLIVTPAGNTVLTDLHPWLPDAVTADVVTVSNEPLTHNQARSVPGHSRILRGRTPEGQWLEVRR